jgi:hypothetical protein
MRKEVYMFIVQFADGSTLKERQHDQDFQGVYWDDLPDKPITALHLTLPGFPSINPPVVTLSNYTRYYFANEARATVMALDGMAVSGVGDGTGMVIKQVIAGVDDRHDFVLYIEVDKKANVTTHRFPLSQFKVRPEALKHGIL